MAPVNSTEPGKHPDTSFPDFDLNSELAGPYETIIMQKNTAIAVILLLVFLFWLGLMLAGMRVINRWVCLHQSYCH
jgi:hypothetical protein